MDAQSEEEECDGSFFWIQGFFLDDGEAMSGKTFFAHLVYVD